MPVKSFTIPSPASAVPATSPGGSNGTLAEVADLCAESLSLLLAQYQESTRLQDLICSYIERIQELETTAVDMSEDIISLDTAEGVQLDLLGRLVGEARDGRLDAAYRLALRVRVLINISNGRIDELIEIVRLFEGTSTTGDIDIQELQPARLEVRVRTAPVNAASETHKRLTQAKAGGVALQTLFHYAGASGSFTFIRAADYPEKSTDQGFTNVPADVTGGEFAHVLG